jgi:catalase
MLKFIAPLAIAALTVLSIAPKSQAIPININSILFEQSSRDSQPRIVVKLGGQPQYSNRWEAQRRREFELQRERDAERRRHRSYSHQDRYDEYDGRYRRDR